MIDFKRLRDIREDNDLNQQDLADILNVSRSRYSLWELGINIIPLKKLCNFADYFNCSIDYILGLSNKKDADNLKMGIDFEVLGRNLKYLRLKNGFSQEYMASILNVTQACIAKYENGNIEISISNLSKYAKKFNISLTELCGKNIKNKVLVNNK